MNFSSTGPSTGLPAWPQASPRAAGLPVVTGDDFALAIDGAMALQAAVEDTTPLTADAIAAGAERRSAPIALGDTAPDALPTAPPTGIPRTANPTAPVRTPAVMPQPTRDARQWSRN